MTREGLAGSEGAPELLGGEALGMGGEQVYLWQSVDGEEAADIGHQHGVHKRVMQCRLKAVRERLTTWSDEVSYAAAD